MKIHGEWVTGQALLQRLDDTKFTWLAEDPDSHLMEAPWDGMGAPAVCPGSFCRSYRQKRVTEGLEPDPDHKPGDDNVIDLLAEAIRRNVALVPVLRRIHRLFGDLGLVVHLYGREHPLIEAVWSEVACPDDTDGDGGCGKKACARCGSPDVAAS